MADRDVAPIPLDQSAGGGVPARAHVLATDLGNVLVERVGSNPPVSLSNQFPVVLAPAGAEG